MLPVECPDFGVSSGRDFPGGGEGFETGSLNRGSFQGWGRGEVKSDEEKIDLGCPLHITLRWHLLSCWVDGVAVTREDATAKLLLMVGEEI